MLVTTAPSWAAVCARRRDNWSGWPPSGAQRAADVRVLSRATAFGYTTANCVMVAQPASGCGRCARRHVVLATGAHERPLVFADNDRPGSCSPAPCGPISIAMPWRAGHAGVLFTNNDSAYRVALDLGRRRRGRGGDRRHARQPRAPAEPPRHAGSRSCEAGTWRARAGDPELAGSRLQSERRAVGHRTIDSLRPAGRLRRLQPRRAPGQPGPGAAAFRCRAAVLRARPAPQRFRAPRRLCSGRRRASVRRSPLRRR